jgi:uncharacterized protein (TIGR02646 family)
MIKIDKGDEPLAWTQKKQTPGFIEYEPIPQLRDALLAEQGYICAYCMREIPVKDRAIRETSKIEHVKSRTQYPNLQLDYTNMVICCPGFLNAEDHCDKLKKGASVTFSLFNDLLPDSISYSSKEGTIKSSNPTWNNEINTILNLNNKILAANRFQVLEGIKAVLEKKKWRRAKIEEKFHEWSNPNNAGKLKPYSGIVIWYLKRKIRQAH